MNQRRLLYTALKHHFHTHPAICPSLLIHTWHIQAVHTHAILYGRRCKWTHLQASREWLNPGYWHRSSVSEVKWPLMKMSAALELSRTGGSQSHWASSKQASMVSSKSLCVFQTVCLHLDGYHVVTGDHGQAKDSGFTLGKCVWGQKGFKKWQSYINMGQLVTPNKKLLSLHRLLKCKCCLLWIHLHPFRFVFQIDCCGKYYVLKVLHVPWF